MFVLYDRAKSAEQVARRAVEASAEFDTGSSLPMALYAVKLAG
jgi:hypothetical protein